jgi:uncharacterized protein (TIGR02466 family)
MIENIFPVQFYKTKYQGDVDQLYNSFKDILEVQFELTKTNNQGSMRYDGLCSYNASRNLHKLQEFNEVTEFISYHMFKFWEELGFNKTPSVTEMWVNKYVPGSFIDTHNHAPILLTASFYLKKEKHAGNIIFEHPMETLLKFQPHKLLQDRDYYHTLFNHEVEVEPGDLVIFPGWLKHRTQPNNSSTDRIIIGANINI